MLYGFCNKLYMLSSSAKSKFLKSVKIRQSYRQSSAAPFFKHTV